MADVVLEKVALRAALDVDGVVRHSGSLAGRVGAMVSRDTTAGTDYPRARVDSLAGTAHVVDVTVAVPWPSPVTRICGQVRTHVADELDRLTGGRPVRVNVTVAALVPGAVRNRRDGLIELPAADDEPVAAPLPKEEPA